MAYAKARGQRVIATTRSAANAARLTTIGAHSLIESDRALGKFVVVV